VTGGLNISPPSKPICLRHAFTASISMTNCSTFSYKGSNCTYHAIFCACTTFCFSWRLFVSMVVLILLERDIFLYRCLTSPIVACNLSSFPCSSYRVPYSNSWVHRWPLFSNNSTTLCIFCVMFSVDVVVF
jgi:hypothetical protein